MIQQLVIDMNSNHCLLQLGSDCFCYMRLQIAKLGMSKNIRTRDGARHFVTKITLPKASDVTSLPLEKNSAVLGDLEKWSKNHWGGGGGRPLSPPVAAPLRA